MMRISIGNFDLGNESVVVESAPASPPLMSIELTGDFKFTSQFLPIPLGQQKVEWQLDSSAMEIIRKLPTRSLISIKVDGKTKHYRVYRRDYTRGKVWARRVRP